MGSTAPRNLRSVAITLAETVQACGVIASVSATSIVSNRLGAGRNVRRRLYDALKVLVAIKIITKSKDGFLKWNGYAHLSPAFLRLDRKRGIIQQLAARIRLANRDIANAAEESLVAPFVIVRAHSQTDISINNNESEGNNAMIILNGYFQILNHSAIIARIARLILLPPSSTVPVPWTRALGPTKRRVEAIAPVSISVPEACPASIPVSMSIFDDDPPLDIIIDDEELSGIEAAAEAFDRKEFGGGSLVEQDIINDCELAVGAQDIIAQNMGDEQDIELDAEPITLFAGEDKNANAKDISLEPESMLLLDSPAFEMALPDSVRDACADTGERYGLDQWV